MALGMLYGFHCQSTGTDISAASAAAAVAGTTAAAAYLNAKYHIREDITNIAKLKIGERGYARAGIYLPISLHFFRCGGIESQIGDIIADHWLY